MSVLTYEQWKSVLGLRLSRADFERDVSNLIYIERLTASTAWLMLTSSMPKGKSEKVGLSASLWYTFYFKTYSKIN